MGTRRFHRGLVVALTLALVAQQVPARLPGLAAAIPASADAASGFDAAFAGSSFSRTVLSPGQSEEVQVFYGNTGTVTWTKGTSTQIDFAACDDGCDVVANPDWNSPANPWLTASRFATTSQTTVAPGAIATFRWVLTAPPAATPGVYDFRGDAVIDSTGERVHPTEFLHRVLVPAARYVVNSNSDSIDDTGCDVAHCTLRGAITAANGSTGTDLITFAIPAAPGSNTITISGALPAISESVWIDGSAGGKPGIEVRRGGAPAASDGLVVTGGSTLLYGLIVNGFDGGAGVRFSTLGRNEIANSYIGTNFAGDAAAANAVGVEVDSDSNSVGIRGAGRNVISGNSEGIVLRGQGNVVVENLIGTNASGDAAVPNVDGIVIGGNFNTIGADAAFANVISGNGAWGILATLPEGAPTGTLIQGNLIGTNAAGTGLLGNGQAGILAIRDTTIGGTGSGSRNVISGNGTGIALRNATAPSTSPSGGNTVRGNYIGTNLAGNRPLPNAGTGVDVESSNNMIGGATASARNVISGNGLTGVRLAPGANTNTVQGNYIGLGTDGHADVANHSAGLTVLSADNIVRDNAISANNSVSPAIPFDHGILLSGTSAQRNLVAGNLIGPAADGTPGFPNSGDGIFVTGGASNNTIGGSAPTDRNLVSGNSLDGIGFDGATTTGNRVLRGSISTNVAKGIALTNGANGGVQPPAITDVLSGATLVVSGTAALNALVQVYADPTDEGLTFLGQTISSDGDGTWTIRSWVYPDMAAIATALKTGALKLHATQTTATGTSEFSGAAAAPTGISGVATCDGDTLLYGATVELFSGSALVASTTASLDTAEFAFVGVAPNSTYTLRITLFVPPIEGDLGGVTITCSATLTTDGSGFGTVNGGVEIPNHRNHVWPQALDMSDASKGATLLGDRDWRIDDYLFQQGQSTWFKVPVRPGQRVLVKVTKVPADYSVAIYKDISKLYQSQIAALSGTPAERLEAIRRLDAAVAPDELSPDELSPDELSPDELSPDELSPDELSPDELSPDELSPDELSPDELSPDELSPDELSPDELSPDELSPDELSAAYAGAQTAALIGVSAHVGLSPEQIARNTWDNSGYFYVRVRGHNGAYDASLPFTLEIKVTDVACTGVTLNDTPLAGFAAAGPNKRTLILTNTAQFPTGTNTTALRSKLDGFAARSEIAGAVVDLKDIAGVASAYAIWNGAQDCPAAANIVARRIKDVINAYRLANPGLAYIVLAGNDHVVPFLRIPDQSGLGSEKDYRPAVQDPTASQASLRFGYVLTQDFYGSTTPISRFDHELYIPDLAVGRLVETVGDMSAVIDAYTAANGVVAPTRSLVTGYDFLADTAAYIADQLQQNALTTDAQLIQPVGEPPSGPNAWTATQLRAKLFGPTTYGILSLNSHFSGNTMLASDYATRLLSNEISGLPATDLRFRNALILSTGCHSGYNIVDPEATALTQPIDWAQAFASRGATVVGGTGYQYGDTDFMKYSEKILGDLVRELRYGTGPVAIGTALGNAKRTYLSSLVSLKGIDEKAVAEATLYGLPMLGYNLPASGRVPAPTSTGALSPTALTTSLSVAAFSPTYALTQNTKPLTQLGTTNTFTATYWDAGGNIAVAPGAPVLPQTVDNVAVSGRALRGAVLLSADYTDQSGMLPFTDVATTEVRGAHAQYLTGVFTPVRPFDLNHFTGTNLVTTPFQYRSATGPDGRLQPTGTGRRLTSEAYRLYYSTLTDARALAAAPAVQHVSLSPSATDATKVDVRVSLSALGPLDGTGALGIEEVWVTFTGETGSLNGHWASVKLTRQSAVTNRLAADGLAYTYVYTGSIPRGTTSADDVRAIIQAVGGNGLVTWASDDGAYYRIVTETATISDPKISTSLSLTAPASGTYRSSATLRARLVTPTGGLNGKRVSFRSGGLRVDAITQTDVASGQAGWATALMPLRSAPGPAALSVGFAEDDDYLGSGADALINITRAPSNFIAADTTVLSGGSVLVATLMGAGEPLGGQLVTLSGAGRTVQTFTDGYGRVRIDTLDGLPAGGFTVTVAFGGNDRYLPAASVNVNVPNAFVTAGGWILTPADALNLVAGKKTNFSLNSKYKSGETVPSGNFEFTAKESNVTFKATSFSTMSVNGTVAEVQGRGTVNGTTGWSFRVRVTEGSPDAFTVTIWKDGRSFEDPNYRAGNGLGGGNVVVHN